MLLSSPRERVSPPTPWTLPKSFLSYLRLRFWCVLLFISRPVCKYTWVLSNMSKRHFPKPYELFNAFNKIILFHFSWPVTPLMQRTHTKALFPFQEQEGRYVLNLLTEAESAISTSVNIFRRTSNKYHHRLVRCARLLYATFMALSTFYWIVWYSAIITFVNTVKQLQIWFLL